MQVIHACPAEFTEALMISDQFFFNKITNKNIELALSMEKKILL